MPDETGKVVYLMRGLPATGKSHTARQLAGRTGCVCETDEFFHTQVGQDPKKYDYTPDRVEEAARWNFDRFCRAVDGGVSPIVVDRGNARDATTKGYARYAVDAGYDVQLKEPVSPWWQEIRVLLKYKNITRPILTEWATRLAHINRKTHRVPASRILRWIKAWKYDLTVEDILQYTSPEEDGC